ncbi:MAG: hypothetical protein V1923_04135 [Candidatus Omnitrophota bacterium]
MEKRWLKEVARDLIALGGIPFLVLTIARVSVPFSYYPMQFIVSSTLFFILKIIFKADLRAGIGLILSIFISLYYRNALFTVFASLVYAGMVISSFYLKKEPKQILKGILLGAISTGIGYAIVRLIYF